MIRRRRLLGTAAVSTASALITAGCELPGSERSESSPDGADARTTDEDASEGASTPEDDADPDADREVLAELITTEQEMINAYQATIEAFENLPDWYQRHLADHRNHLEALRAVAANLGDAGDAAAPEELEQATPEPPGEPARAARQLSEREKQAIDRRDHLLERARDGGVARLVAVIAASDALHRDRFEEGG